MAVGVEVSRTSEVTLSFDDRAAAEATTTGTSKFIIISGILYEYDAAGTALTTGDGRNWSFADEDEYRSFDKMAEIFDPVRDGGFKLQRVDTDYETAPNITARSQTIYQGKGSFPGTNQDAAMYRRQVVPDDAASARGHGGLDLSGLTSLSGKKDVTIVVVGDSLTTWQANQIVQTDGLTERLTRGFKEANPEKNITVVGRGIGSTQFSNLDTAPPPATAALYDWYLVPTNPWLDYVESANPDIVVISMGMNDRQNFNRTYFESVLTKIAAFTNPPHVILCTPMVPTLDPHASNAPFGTYADQEGRDWNAGYQRTWAQYNGIPLIDINRTFGMVRDGRDILDLSFVGHAEEPVSPAGNWTATAEQACRGWSAILKVDSGAWSDPGVFSVSLSTAAGNVVHIQDVAGFLRFRYYNGPGSLVGGYNSTIPTPTSSVDVEITVRGGEFSFRIYEKLYQTQPFTFNVIRYGGLYQPYIGLSTGALGAVHSVKFNQGIERPYLPLGTDLDIWGEQNATGALDPITGGGGPNHPSSKGAQLVYGTHFEAESFKIPDYDKSVDAKTMTITTATAIDMEISDRSPVVRYLDVTIAGSYLAATSVGKYIGQQMTIHSLSTSTDVFTFSGAILDGAGVNIAVGASLTVSWNGAVWVR